MLGVAKQATAEGLKKGLELAVALGVVFALHAGAKAVGKKIQKIRRTSRK